MNADMPFIVDTRWKSTSDAAIRTAVPILAVLQWVAPYLHQLTGLGRKIGGDAQTTLQSAPIVPLPYAFVIWFPIFLGCVVYGVHQVRRQQRGDEGLAALAPWAAGAFLFSIAWSIIAQLRDNWLTAPILAGIPLCLLVGLVRYHQAPRQHAPRDALMVVGTLELYAGWTTVAFFANIATVLARQSPPNLGWNAGVVSTVLLMCCAGAIVMVLRRLPVDGWYALAVLWALFAIFLANIFREPRLAFAGLAAFVMLLVVALGFIAPSPRRTSS
jgi:hypothetical protein